ncbi:sevA [Symbiodinium natans]|uniref:SevA protein n=1 Tax=Symbiodinium natans TaxID=878477 RepID=A0A812NE58_9DINO|nr:sevA [Symbiodinium natans]
MAAEDWRDSNVGAIGGDEDKAVRKLAAAKEPAWEGAGTKPGIQVWRIEHFHVVPVETSLHGQFHKGDSYIVLHTEEVDGKLMRTIFFYIGTESSTDEKGTAAYKTVELDDYFQGEPKQVREEMGKESPAFAALFSGSLKYLDGGVDSGFKHVVPEGHDTKLFQVRKVKGKTTVLQVPTKKEMVNDSDSFVLDAPGKIYVYDGPQASPFEKQAANRHAEHLESMRSGHAQATHDIDDTFWTLLTAAACQSVAVSVAATVVTVAIVATATAATVATVAIEATVAIVVTAIGIASVQSVVTEIETVIVATVAIVPTSMEVVGGAAAAGSRAQRFIGQLQPLEMGGLLRPAKLRANLHNCTFVIASFAWERGLVKSKHADGFASRCLAELLQSDEGQVCFLVKFLMQRGRSAAAEMRNRLAKGQPVQARGFHFNQEVIAEALRRWEVEEEEMKRHICECREVASTRWLKLQTLTYRDEAGRDRRWDSVSRTTRRASLATSGVDAVAILAVLRSSANPGRAETLLVQQFRPPVDCPTIELPAGLVDEGETAQEAALRELKEETGYIGTVAECSGVLTMSPGLCDEMIRLVVVDVDLDRPENQSPAQQLDETERIVVRRVPLDQLLQELEVLIRQGCMPIAGLYFLAVGLRLGLRPFGGSLTSTG